MKNSQTQPTKILIIDDDVYTSEMYAMHLRKAGYLVDIKTDGAKGYDSMCKDNYDIILLDIMLPELDGSELLAKWRKSNPKGSKPPIVILTNYEQTDSTRAKLAANSDGYVIKAAITPRSLVQIIEKTLSE